MRATTRKSFLKLSNGRVAELHATDLIRYFVLKKFKDEDATPIAFRRLRVALAAR
jgi:hypothetical protein